MHKLFQFCCDLGIQAMTSVVDPENYNLATKLSKEYDVKVAIHNHGIKCPYGTFEKLDSLLNNSSELGLCLDTTWIMQAGHCALEALDRYKEHIYAIHLKDFKFNDDGYEDVVPGDGALNLDSAMQK